MLKVTWFNVRYCGLRAMSRTALRQVVPVVQTTVFDAYIVGLAPWGRRGITSLLNRSASILKHGADAADYPWEQLTTPPLPKCARHCWMTVTPCHRSTWRCQHSGA